MRNPLTLAWWILILGILEASALILDHSQHLFWGRIGILLLKVSYLVFAGLLMFRFLSFRSRKSYESMADSYRRISGRSWSAAGKERVEGWRKLFFHTVLFLIASTDFLTPLIRGDRTFKTSILLDLVFWLMALHWVVRASWLKTLGRRERLKAGLDDARSQFKTPFATAPDAASPRNAVWPFAILFALAASATLALGAQRWRKADAVYAMADLKGCLRTCLDRALDRFHQEGRLEQGLQAEDCLYRHRDEVDVGVGFQRGELLLWAIEKPGRDYFGNGRTGDQGLMLDAEGRFRDSGRRR